jgi:hypothetical protein
LGLSSYVFTHCENCVDLWWCWGVCVCVWFYFFVGGVIINNHVFAVLAVSLRRII